MKLFIKILAVSVLLVSCGTRKRVMQKSSSLVKAIEKKDIVKNDNINIETNAFIIREVNKVVYRPVDSEKPMIVDGQESINTIIEKETINEIDSTKTETEITSNHTDNSTIEIDKKEDEKTTTVDRDNSFGFWGWFWLFLAFGIVMILLINRIKIFRFFKKLN
ncbi:hypothetical protein [Aquimarina sp. Aq78]|uniref:hypothetical protein n=1 Tax=Aquimarina sp. Aq78 TaxID=1191889 RepID=UPI000D0F1391|nr:hypothetical protein [Aquimarina sp. Aq78]